MINKLYSERIPFYYTCNIGNNIEEARFIFELSNKSLYLAYEPFYDEEQSFEDSINERFNYYCTEIKEDEFNCDFFKNHKLKFDILCHHIDDIRYSSPTDYLLLKIEDFKTFVFFLTSSHDDFMSIFSSDFDENFLKTYLDEYYQNLDKYRSMTSHEYILSKHGDYIAAKKFIFYDTYADDEDDNYLFITGDKKVFNDVVGYFYGSQEI